MGRKWRLADRSDVYTLCQEAQGKRCLFCRMWVRERSSFVDRLYYCCKDKYQQRGVDVFEDRKKQKECCPASACVESAIRKGANCPHHHFVLSASGKEGRVGIYI